MNPRYYEPEKAANPRLLEADIGIYGATSAGIVAAIQARRMGKSVVLLEAGGHIGGMTTGGLSRTDAGRKHLLGGIAREAYRAFGKVYGKEEEWLFEPHVAQAVFNQWLENAEIPLFRYQYLSNVRKDGSRIKEIECESGLRLRAKVFLDTSYEGDLLARAGVRFVVGREGNNCYNELYNGSFIALHHQFDRPIDPYLIPGQPESGLLPGIDPTPLSHPGEADARVQAYNFRLCITEDPANQRPFPKPEGYDALDYELLGRVFDTGWQEEFIRFDPIAGNKVDLNNYGPVSTDWIGGSWGWPLGSFAEREAIFQAHIRYQQGLLWFRANDPRVPAAEREKIRRWGLAQDEFCESGGWPPQLYVREARRMLGQSVLTEHQCLGAAAVKDPVAVGSYQMDSHNCRRWVQHGRVLNEGDVQLRVHPYGISWRTLLPHPQEASNLIVPVCLSASHISWGSVRMEPVFMALGQSAATAAALSLDAGCAPHALAYSELRAQLLADGQILDPSTPAPC